MSTPHKDAAIVWVSVSPTGPSWNAKAPHHCYSLEEPGVSITGLPLYAGMAVVTGLVEAYVRR